MTKGRATTYDERVNIVKECDLPTLQRTRSYAEILSFS